jgi:hypothetical protein
VFYITSCIVYHISKRSCETCFAVTKVSVQASSVTEFFCSSGESFFMITSIKAVYFNLLSGFGAFDCKRSNFFLCQLCIFFGCCEMLETGES